MLFGKGIMFYLFAALLAVSNGFVADWFDSNEETDNVIVCANAIEQFEAQGEENRFLNEDGNLIKVFEFDIANGDLQLVVDTLGLDLDVVNDQEQIIEIIEAIVFQGTCMPAQFDIINTDGQVINENIEDVTNKWMEFIVLNNDVDLTFFEAAKLVAQENTPIPFTGFVTNFAIASTVDVKLAKGPGVFCIDDQQCSGIRLEQRAGDLAARTCLNQNESGSVQVCNDYVARFTLTWLLFFIMASYGILILWALYWTIPYLRKKFKGGKGGSRGKKGKPMMNPADQVLVNTLAAQCAASENMLLMATDFVKQAKGMASVKSVEAQTESRIMIYVCEYFQAVASVVVALTHQYLEEKLFTEGAQFNMHDPTTRALQLEILNYIRTRIQLSFNSDSMTEKSLIRLAEAYAILKKVSEAMVFVGFTVDRQFEDSLGNLRTPKVEFTENSFFMSGIWKSTASMAGLEQYNNMEVCVTVSGADTRGLQSVEADKFLTGKQKQAKNFDANILMTSNTVGNSFSYNAAFTDNNNEGIQYFARTFWGPEIAAMQAESRKWGENNGGLESFLDRERVEREGRAQPMVKQGSKPKRRRKKKKKKEEYTEDNDVATEYTDAESETSWTVDDSNTYVFNVQAVAAHGLGIAGKPNVPFDKPGEEKANEGSKIYRMFETYFPNYAEWPKFYTFFFVIMPIVILIPWLAKIGQGAKAIDIDGNVNFKARPAGFGTSYLGVPAYYFLDAEIPDENTFVRLVSTDNVDVGVVRFEEEFADPVDLDAAAIGLGLNEGADLNGIDPFGVDNGRIWIRNIDTLEFFRNDWDGGDNRRPEIFLGEVQAGILVQPNADDLAGIRNQQKAQEVTTMFVYGLMHTGAYFFGMVPLTLIRESLEILARRFSVIRQVYPMSQWRELHMSMGLAGILFVVFGSTFFLITQLISIGKGTPFAGLGGDPEIAVFFNFTQNVLYIRQVLLPAVPLLLLMKYASRGPPRLMRKYAPKFITMNYWEICYFLHYFTALTAIIVLVIYRAQVFYWMGATWGIVWGGNKVVRILRTRRATIQQADLISYTVEDTRNNAKKRSDVLRITLNVPSSFPSSARGQACWITCPEIDFVAHPFTLARTPTETEKVIMFHIAVRYLPGDDVMSFAKPESAPAPKATEAPPADPSELPTGWKAAVDPSSGQTYYYNSAEQRTTWTRPKASGGDAFFDGVRGITSRLSANFLRGNSSARFGPDIVKDKDYDPANTRQFVVRERATWTQKFASLARKLQNLDPQLRSNAMKNHPIYVSAPLGTSMDDAIKPDVPGSIIITTQNGLPAAESSVRWLLLQEKSKRPIFHFFVSVVREVNDALAVCEMLREAMAESVVRGHLNVDGLSKHAHIADWLGIYLHLTRRTAKTIVGDREMLFRALNPPQVQIDEKSLEIIDNFIKSRIMPGRLPFDRFLTRTQQMVRKRSGDDRMVVAYCGSYKVANSLRSACRKLHNVHFDGEYI